MGYVSDLVAQGYGGYRGWGENEARADFEATGGRGKWDPTGPGVNPQISQAYTPAPSPNIAPLPAAQVGNPVDDLIKQSIEAYQKQLDDYKAKAKEFDEKNPFVFDDVLASKRLEVSDRLDPYYNQTLEDFLRGINVRRTRSLEDEQRILSELTADVQDYTGKARSLLEDALDKSRQGFADANAFFSGERLREEGRARERTAQSVSDVERQAERRGAATTLSREREAENLGLEEQLKRRDIGREKYAQTEQSALQETNLAQLRRDVERSQYIGAPYAAESLSNLPSTFSNYL